MAVTIFKNAAHYLASFVKSAAVDLAKLASTKPVVEAVTAAIPGGAPFVTLEDALYALFGEVGKVVSVSGDAGAAKLADAGLDIAVIQGVQSLIKTVPGLVANVKAVDAKFTAAPTR